MSTPAYLKASPLEFRLRLILHAVIYGLGFWSPWNYLLHTDATGPNAHVWGVLSATLAKNGILNIGAAFDLLLAIGILCAVLGAALRTWGTAYLGSGIVQDSQMQAPQMSKVVAAGPYRHLRNPLYLGIFLHTFALALLMPETGAIFTIIAIGVLQIRLILGEESFLEAKLGDPYVAYKALVPRLIPTIRSRVSPSTQLPHWGQAFLGEIYVWGVACSFAFAGWRYNASLLTQCVLVSFGISLLTRALIPKPTGAP